MIAPHNTSQLEGNNVTFTCNATAEPIHTVEWSFNNFTLPYDDVTKYLIDVSSDDASYGALTVFDVQLNDTGQYTCLVNNTHGNDTASAYLTVQGKPSLFTLLH